MKHLSCGKLIFILQLVSLVNPRRVFRTETCDTKLLNLQTLGGFNIRSKHFTSTSIRISWSLPEIVKDPYPDYYCIVYSSKKGEFEEVTDISKVVKTINHREFEITDLKPNMYYEIIIKPCVNGNCLVKSVPLRVHT